MQITLITTTFILLSLKIANAQETQLVFNQTINMNIVKEAVQSNPEILLKVIAKQNVDVLKVEGLKLSDEEITQIDNPDITNLKNPIFAKVNKASADLLKKAEWQDSYSGRMISKLNPCCQLKKDTIIIRDTATNYTLIHEFMHSLIKSNNKNPNLDVESQFGAAYRRMSFYQKKLFEDPYNLLQALWRKDILSAITDVSNMLFERIEIGQSQEAIIEKILSKEIDKTNIHYNEKRSKQGFLYGERSVNNAIDVFNNTFHGITWNKNTVRGLRESIVSGDIDKSEDQNLSEKSAEQFSLSADELLKKIEKTKTEILLLKDYYSKP